MKSRKGEPRRCIFCGKQGKVTKEHVWPQWARDHLKFDDDRYTAASVQRGQDKAEHPSARNGGGDPRFRTLRVVCRDCNSGWMGALQEAAKPLLLAMIGNEPLRLTYDDQATLAAWATMTFMVAENFFGDLIISPEPERYEFRNSQRALPNWKVWIARYEREAWRAHYVRIPLPLKSPDAPATADGESGVLNSFAATFVFGNVLFQAFMCPYVAFTDGLEIDDPEGRIVQVWPPRAPVDWPTPQLSEAHAKRFVTMIADGSRRERTDFDHLFPGANRQPD